MRSRTALLLVCLLGCAREAPSARTAPSTPSPATKAPAQGADGAAQHPPDRALGPVATFGELVATARALDDAGAGDSEARCLLRGSGDRGAGWRLEADLAVAVRPLPRAGDHLGERVARTPDPVAVLSRWGRRGPQGAEVAFVAFTHVPPPGPRPMLVLVATADAVHVRSTAPGTEIASSTLTWETIASDLRTLPDASVLVVTADAEVPLTRLHHLLSALPDGAPSVTLAVAFAPDTKLPEPLESQTAQVPLCPGGLPEPPEQRPEGELTAEQAMRVLRSMQPDAGRCLSTFPEAAGGGTLDLHLRIGSDGRVSKACVVRDAIDSSPLRRCILSVVEALRFPAPGGLVDLRFPLTMEPPESSPPSPICKPAGPGH